MASRSIARGIAVFTDNSAALSRRVWVLVLVVVMVLSLGTVMAFSAESYADSRQSGDAVKVDDMIVPVQPVRVDPRTGEPIACADCQFPTKPYVSSADLDDGTSDAYRLIVGERLHSLWYEAGGVKVPLRSFTSQPDAAANGKRAGTVTLHPLLPDGNAAGEQDSVSLTIRAEDLEWDHNADTPTIFMGYAPQVDWQRMYLTKEDLDADIQVNGVPLSGGRFMDAFLGGVTGQTGAQTVTETDSATGQQVEVEVPYRDVMISVPSGRSIAFTRYTADDVKLDGTIYTGDGDVVHTVTAQYLPEVVDDVSVPGRTIRVYRLYLDAWLDPYEVVKISSTTPDSVGIFAATRRDTVSGTAGGSANPDPLPVWDCAGGKCDISFKDADRMPFFLKVASTDRSLGTAMLATPLWERWGFGKQNHAVDGGGISYGVGADEVIDPQLKAPLPMPEDQALSASDLAAYSRVQDVAPQTWYGSLNPSGQADFYVQYNGMPYSEQAGRSRFLGGVSIGGIWYSIPFPALPSTPLPSIEDHHCAHDGDPGCQPEAGVDKAGHDVGAYARARQNMLGPLIEEKRPTYVMPGDHRDAAGNSPLVGCELTEPHTYSPRRIVTREINSGPNAGVTITVELVNARTQGDQLADGFSVKASADAHLEEGKWKWVDRRYRHHPSPSLGPATQMTNTSRCFDIPSETYPWHFDIDGTRENNVSKNRSQAAWNRWKTLYKVSISGLPHSDHLYFRYDGTGVTTTTLTDGAKVLISAERLDLSGYRSNENIESAWTNFLGLDANDSGVVRASDMVYASTTNPGHPDGAVPDGGNVRITLKPGYVNPVLTTVTGRTDLGVTSAACGPESTSCRVVRHDAPSADGSDGGTVTYAWKPTFVSDEPVRYGGDADAHARIGTSVAEPMEITADLLAVPVVAMAADDSGTPTGAASSAVVPEQWRGQELTPGSADMGAGRFITVTGAAPVPADESLTFAGYKLVGATCGGAAAGETSGCAASNLEDLSAGRFFPGDTIDLDALRLTDGLNLANDTLDGARYTALWLVPTFAAPGSGTDHGAAAATGAGVGRPNLPLYRVDELVEGDDGRFHRAGVYRQVAAAPGATLTLADEAFQASPAQLEGRSRVAERSRLTAVVPAPTRTEAAPAGTSGGTSVAPARAALLARTFGADHVAGSPGALTSGGAVLAGGTTPSLASTPALTGAEVSAGEGDGTDAAGADVVMADGKRADAQPARPLWIAYSCGAAVCGQRATLEASRAPIDGELGGVEAPADPAGKDGATLTGTLSGAENGVTVKRSGTGVVNLPGDNPSEKETAAARSATQLSASWTWADQPGQYTWDPWRCTVDGASGSGGGASVTGEAAAGADSGAAGAPQQDVTVALSTDATVRCGVVFHTSQVTLLVSGLENDATPGLSLTIPATEGGSAQSVYAPASGTTVATLRTVSAADTAYVQPGRTYRLGGASWVGTRYLATWQRYTGNNPNDPDTTDTNQWKTVAGPGESANVTPAADRHEVYRAVYQQAMLPRLPFTGASAQLYLFIGLLLAGVAAVTAPWARRRHA